MRRMPTVTLAILSAIMISAAPLVHAATQSIDGVVSDTMCGKKHMLPGKTAAQCIQECMKGKVSYALVAGARVYTLAGMPQTIAPLAGKRVHVNGDLNDNTLTVISIHETKPETKRQMDM